MVLTAFLPCFVHTATVYLTKNIRSFCTRTFVTVSKLLTPCFRNVVATVLVAVLAVVIVLVSTEKRFVVTTMSYLQLQILWFGGIELVFSILFGVSS